MHTKTTRRAVLAGAAAAPALALPAVTLPGAHPDAELLALGRELERARAAAETARGPWLDAHRRIEAALPRPGMRCSQAKYNRWRDQWEQAHAQPDVRRVCEVWNDASGKEWDIAEGIRDMPAHTMEGLSVKLEAIETTLRNVVDGVDSLEWKALADDIRRLAGKAVAS